MGQKLDFWEDGDFHNGKEREIYLDPTTLRDGTVYNLSPDNWFSRFACSTTLATLLNLSEIVIIAYYKQFSYTALRGGEEWVWHIASPSLWHVDETCKSRWVCA